jgi:hypothetical protein
MKRFRLSTLMLLIVIAALGIALVVQHGRAALREADLQRVQMAYSQLLAKQPREDPWEPFLKRYREEWAKRELKKQAEKGMESE